MFRMLEVTLQKKQKHISSYTYLQILQPFTKTTQVCKLVLDSLLCFNSEKRLLLAGF